MANVYDAVTRSEALQQAHYCDPKSSDVIRQLVRWLDEADAATSQRKYNDLLISLGAANDKLRAAEQQLAELTAAAKEHVHFDFTKPCKICAAIHKASPPASPPVEGGEKS